MSRAPQTMRASGSRSRSSSCPAPDPVFELWPLQAPVVASFEGGEFPSPRHLIDGLLREPKVPSYLVEGEDLTFHCRPSPGTTYHRRPQYAVYDLTVKIIILVTCVSTRRLQLVAAFTPEPGRA